MRVFGKLNGQTEDLYLVSHSLHHLSWCQFRQVVVNGRPIFYEFSANCRDLFEVTSCGRLQKNNPHSHAISQEDKGPMGCKENQRNDGYMMQCQQKFKLDPPYTTLNIVGPMAGLDYRGERRLSISTARRYQCGQKHG